jgi:hypothetical protein
LPEPAVAACADGAVTIETAESVESAKTKGITEATLRLTWYMKSARLNAIPMHSFRKSVDSWQSLNWTLSAIVEL